MLQWACEENDEHEHFNPINIKAFKDLLLKLLKRKGVYPYEYVDSFDQLEELSLPPKEKFYSTLTDTHISDEEYEHALNVWNKLCVTFGDYHDIYLKTDVLLLCR